MQQTQFLNKFLVAALGCTLALATGANAAFLIEVDTDGLDDGVLTFSPNFSFGGDTTTASQSATSPAVGMTGGDSIFGGNGTATDTYLFTYDLDVDGDNLVLAAGTPLNDDGDVASGVTAGGSDEYNVYATWPRTNNVSGGLTTYTLTDDMSNVVFSVSVDQNTIQGGVDSDGMFRAGGEWIFLGSGALDASKTYTLTQDSGAATFVSMRSAGVLFEPVPEPAGAVLLLSSCLLLAARRRLG